jgi:dTDP-4-dehydrorhamnose 3,5-epimerase
MRFQKTPLKDSFLIEPEIIRDERGFFMRTFCEKEFERENLNVKFVQCSLSFNAKKGTVRAFHFQIEPYAEAKLIRCLRGALWDVIIDLRATSSTFQRHFAVRLDAENGHSLYIPKGFAHGFQTLEDSTEVFYQISAPFEPTAARGIRFDDPFFNIAWPLPVSVISKKDQSHPLYHP